MKVIKIKTPNDLIPLLPSTPQISQNSTRILIVLTMLTANQRTKKAIG